MVGGHATVEPVVSVVVHVVPFMTKVYTPLGLCGKEVPVSAPDSLVSVERGRSTGMAA